MEQKPKISIRKVLQLVVTVVVTIGCVIAIVGAATLAGTKPVSRVEIHINNGKKYQFIEQNELLELAITNKGLELETLPMAKLDLKDMERTLVADPWVANAQVYIDNDRVLHLNVTQRVPVARIFGKDSSSYYIDTMLATMPIPDKYVFYTTAVTNVPDMGEDSAGMEQRRQIVALVRKIQADSFWNAQVSQVIVASAGNYELMPVLGDQRIIVGSLADIDDKLSNLYAFYKNVLNRIGWDKYQTLDLRYHGQVVAKPSLPFKGPEDKAVSVNKMSWIESIIETEAARTAVDTAVVPVVPKPRLTVAEQKKEMDAIQPQRPMRKEKEKGKEKEQLKKMDRHAKADMIRAAGHMKPRPDKKDAKATDKHSTKAATAKESSKAKGEQNNVAASAANAKVKLPAKKESAEKPKPNKDAASKSKAAPTKQGATRKEQKSEKKEKVKNGKAGHKEEHKDSKQGAKSAPKYTYPDKKSN